MLDFPGDESSWYVPFSLAAMLFVVILFGVTACGGSGKPTTPTVTSVSSAIASARTLPAMERAFTDLLTLLGVPSTDVGHELILRFAQYQLDQDPSERETVEEVYNRLNAMLLEDPELADQFLYLTVQEFLDLVNPALVTAYANRNDPASAPYILFSSLPGQIPGSAPVMQTSTRITVVQGVMMMILRSDLWVELNPDFAPGANYDRIAAMVGLSKDECEEACHVAHGNCRDQCQKDFQDKIKAIGE